MDSVNTLTPSISTSKYIVKCDQKKGKFMVATENIYIGEIILDEYPLICSQYLWNAEYKYDACQYCLTPLENAEETVSRLTKEQIKLPYLEQCCQTDKSKHTHCKQCFERYCSDRCLQLAFENYHRLICPLDSSTKLAINLNKLCELWKSTHYPPEMASIMLLVKILAKIKQNKSFIEKLTQFSCNTSTETMTMEQAEKYIHKLCGDKFREQTEILRQTVIEIFENDELLRPFLNDQGFKSLLALIGKNSQGIGTNAFCQWANNCQRLVANDPNECAKINQLIDSLFEKMDEVSGPFLNIEGSGLYEKHHFINHSCEPNAEVCFPYNNFQLVIKALRTIQPGEEITISYLDECWKEKSRHSRQKFIQENYLFVCECLKCQREINDPDVTSEEEEESSQSDLVSGDDDDDDDKMICD